MGIIEHGKMQVEFHLQEPICLEPNQIVVFNPNQVHQTKESDEKIKDYYLLHVDISWCQNIQAKHFQTNGSFVDLVFNIIDDNKICMRLKSIFQRLHQEKDYIEELEKVLISILTEYSSVVENDKSKENKLLDLCERYIVKNQDRQISLKDLSLGVGYSESYITKVFKKQYGLTPHAYIVNKKINKVKNTLLKTKNISLANLSQELGFYDQSHLTKVFKRMHGITPNKYND